MSGSGGPAFPVPISDCGAHPDTGELYFPGMTLRDYFAAAALAGICGDGIPGQHHRPEQTALDAYRFADAMLKAREQ